MMKGNKALMEVLRREGVEYVFGIPGATEILFMDALREAPGIRYILGLHEVVCAAMAEGYARASGKVGFLYLHTATGVAAALPGRVLHAIFPVFMFLVAAQMLRPTSATQAHRKELPGRVGVTGAGTAIGVLSAIFGIGGGSLSVPFMTWFSVPVRNAIATSSAIGFPIAVASTLGYVVAGWGVAGLPPWSIGYVNLPGFTGVVIASTLCAPFGAAIAHRISETALRRIFAAFLVVLGLRMMFS